MSDLSFIQGKLRGPPFNMASLTVGSLGQMSGEELLQTLMDACMAVQPKLPHVSVAKNGPEAVAERVEFFLHMVKYHHSKQLQPGALLEGLMQCRQTPILEILGWMASNADLLHKRAHVGWFLTELPMPDDMNMDQQAGYLLEDTRAAQQQFVQLHRKLQELEVGRKDPAVLSEQMSQMQEDKQRLQDRILKMRLRTEQQLPQEDFSAMLASAETVRSAQDEVAFLRQQVEAERQKTEHFRSRLEAAKSRMAALKAATEAGSARQLLDSQRARVAGLRDQVQGSALKQLNDRQRRLDSLTTALALPMKGEADLQALLQQRVALEQDVAGLKAAQQQRQREMDSDPAFAALRTQAQMLKVAAKKLEERRHKLERMENRRNALKREAEARFGSEDPPTMGGGHQREVSAAALQQKAEEVRALLGEFRAAKKLMDNVESEEVVLKRTVETLRVEREVLREEVRKMEEAHGVEGYVETQAGLEKISEQKATVDEGKKGMLDEISQTVAGITAKIKERQAELAPRIQARKDAKQRLVDLETEMEGKNGQMRKAMADASGGFTGLEQEVAGMLQEAAQCEQLYHLAGAMEPGVDYLVRMVDARTSSSSVELQALKDRVGDWLSTAKEEKMQLEEKMQGLAEQSASMMGQEEVVRGLMRLLQAKVQSHGAVVGGLADPAESYETAQGNVMIF